MSDAKNLSMDEILTAIRRVIAEDEQDGGSGAHRGGAGSDDRDDILELTRALNEDGTIRELAPIGGGPHHAAEPPAAPVALEPSTRPVEVAAPGLEPAAPRLEPAPPRLEPELTRRDSPAAGPVQTAQAIQTAQAAPTEGLMSDTTSTAAAAALARLAAVRGDRRQEPEMPRVGDRPLDDIVRELLQPLLRSWLDENLPEMVERLVRAEIARVTRKSGMG